MISTEFKQNVESGDIITVRSALVDYLIIDRSFSTFDEALSYARTRLNVVQEFDGGELEIDADVWDDDYLNGQKVELMLNFSERRIQHLKNVIKKVLPDNQNKTAYKDSSRPTYQRNESNGTGRTGRVVLSETPVEKHTHNDENAANRSYKNVRKEERRVNSENTVNKSNPKTTSTKKGSTVIEEKVTREKRVRESESSEDGIGTALIVGGVVVAAVGLVVTEPIIVGAGVVVAGAGVGVKVKKRR